MSEALNHPTGFRASDIQGTSRFYLRKIAIDILLS
jgi:hypothetical protein